MKKLKTMIAEPNVIETILPDQIENLDLHLIKLKLTDKEEGKGWTSDYCDSVEIDYKRFLFLKLMYPDKDIVPNKEIDSFWHQHILDTEKYFFDCKSIFGKFIHHYPYFGMNGPDDYKNLCDAFDETGELYKFHFNIEYAKGKGSGKCRTACKPQKCR